jgi:hypothetical protein
MSGKVFLPAGDADDIKRTSKAGEPTTRSIHRQFDLVWGKIMRLSANQSRIAVRSLLLGVLLTALGMAGAQQSLAHDGGQSGFAGSTHSQIIIVDDDQW